MLLRSPLKPLLPCFQLNSCSAQPWVSMISMIAICWSNDRYFICQVCFSAEPLITGVLGVFPISFADLQLLRVPSEFFQPAMTFCFLSFMIDSVKDSVEFCDFVRSRSFEDYSGENGWLRTTFSKHAVQTLSSWKIFIHLISASEHKTTCHLFAAVLRTSLSSV